MTEPRRWDILGIGDTDRDLFIRVPRIPSHDEKVTGSLIGEHSGGMAANFCVSAARLGAAVGLSSVVGDDERGRLALADLVREGVDTEPVEVRAGGRTYFCVVHLDASGEKALTVVPTDCMFPSREKLAALDLGQARLVHLAPAELDRAIEVALRAQESAAMVSLDLEPLMVERDRGRTAKLLRHVDIVMANESGARALTGPTGPAPDELLEFGPRIAVVTRGGAGAVAATADEQVETQAAYVPVVDTTGAGDCFNAAFCVAVLHGWSLQASLDFATASAGLSVQQVGGHAGSPIRAAVERVLERGTYAPSVQDVRSRTHAPQQPPSTLTPSQDGDPSP